MEQSEIDELITSADRRAVYTNQLEHAKERYRSMNILAWEGHIFELNHHFIATVYMFYMEWVTTDENARTPIIFLDKNEEPVMISDMVYFVEQIQERHTEALNDYYDTYNSLQLARTTEELIEVS